jgi:Ni/Co efflux regulator RcnB
MSNEREEKIETEIAWTKQQLLAAIDAGRDAQAQNFQRDLLKLRGDLEREREREHQRQESKRQRLEHDVGESSWLSGISSWFFGERRSTAELLNAVAEMKTSVTDLANSLLLLETIMRSKDMEG